MKIRKAFSAMALTALLAVPFFGFTNNSANAHAAIIHARGYKRVSLPYSYRGTWGAQRSNTVIGAGAQKNPAAAKFYKRTGYFENQGTNTKHAFAKSHDFKGYASLFMNKHRWGEMQGGAGFVLDKKDHALDYIVGNESWNLHHISNRAYNSMLHQARYHKKRQRNTNKRKLREQKHYISRYKKAYGMNPTTARNLYTSNELAQIKSDRQEYHYLLNNENSKNVSKSDYDQEVIDWINFFRTYIYNESPINIDSSYSRKAQSDIDNGTDPEDMDSGEAPKAVEGYFTDKDNADHNGTAGHRDSILRADADYVGVGRSNKYGNSLYFDWGLDNGAANMDYTRLSYPCGYVFPLADAKEAEYWCFQIYDRPYSNQGRRYPTPNIEVHDDTTDENVPISHITMKPNEVYYAVDTNMLKANHQYTITLTGEGVSHSDVRTITTKLFNM